MWQAPLSSIHSLPSSRDVSAEDHPRAVYCQGLYFVGLARTLPPLPIHHPLVFSKKLSRIPKEDPLKKLEGVMNFNPEAVASWHGDSKTIPK
jgi:hypothetical protein